MTIYHLTAEGEVRPCNAKKTQCRYRDLDHYRNRNDARTAVEQQKESGYTVSSMLRRDCLIPPSSKTHLKKSALSANSTSEVESVGKDFLTLVEETLPFQVGTVDLTYRVLTEIQHSVQENYSKLCRTDAPLKNPILGPRKKEVRNSFGLVPDRVKSLLMKEEIVIKHSDSRDKKMVDCSKVINSSVDLGVLSPITEYSPDRGFLVEEESSGKVYWAGGKPPVNLRRVSDYCAVTVAGRVKRLRVPVYAVYPEDARYERLFRVPNTPDEDSRKSSLLHSYSHLIQDRIKGVDYEEVYSRYARGRKYSSNFSLVVDNGFPVEKLGVNPEEFFPYSSSALFYPTAEDNFWLWRKESYSIRCWTAGVWVILAYGNIVRS